jgi:hypothetical protein
VNVGTALQVAANQRTYRARRATRRAVAEVTSRPAASSRQKIVTPCGPLVRTVVFNSGGRGVDPAPYLIEAARIAKLSVGDQHLMPWDFKRE